MKKSESKRSESKSSDTPARRGKAESLSQYMETPPLASKPGKKKAPAASTLEVNQATLTEQDKTQFEVSDVMAEVRTMNAKLITMDNAITKMNNQFNMVMMKNDSELKATIRDLLVEMKEELLMSVYKSIEVLEGKLFDKETENSQLLSNIKSLEQEIESQKNENSKLQDMIYRNNEQRLEKDNDHEQYSRRNNIIINGLKDNDPQESAIATAEKVIKVLNLHKVTEGLSMTDIDVAHRLQKRNHKDRDIVVRFVSRNVKEEIIKKRRMLKGSGIFINEDLTVLNHKVLMSVKKKRGDIVSNAWSKNGKIIYKDNTDKIHTVPYSDYKRWLDLPWPV